MFLEEYSGRQGEKKKDKKMMSEKSLNIVLLEAEIVLCYKMKV